jgi:hypothetical protein
VPVDVSVPQVQLVAAVAALQGPSTCPSFGGLHRLIFELLWRLDPCKSPIQALVLLE